MSSGKKPQGAGNDYVLLESSDGYTFVVSRKIACASGMLKNMLDEDGKGCILLKVIEYLAYKVQYQEFNAEDVQEDFQDRIDPYIALELLTAADYLDC
ncbi:hypothetical protein I350_01977 [Cryptococcus amylolentus CBS 6273]|uniref:Elongin-C n=1 Tax=Cryptococcus amylolentus CBS 6273 TaxID=1296118 RepID=A0A1E3K9E4_9TREE|nr:hypothetical protein I350_01977 [Cryptococcus amylolentus CBS 6273]